MKGNKKKDHVARTLLEELTTLGAFYKKEHQDELTKSTTKYSPIKIAITTCRNRVNSARKMTNLDAEKEVIHLMQPPEEKPTDPQETNKRHRHGPQEHSKPRNNHSKHHNRNGNTSKGNWEQQYPQNNQRRAHNHPGRGHIPTTPCKGVVDSVDPTKKYFFINLIQLEGNTSIRIFFHMDSRTQAQQQHRFADGDIVRIIECAHTPKGIEAVRIEIVA